MPSICFYFQVHQPYRAKKYSVFNVGNDHDYFESPEDRLSNEKIFHKVAEKSYLPTNKVILGLLNKHPEMKVSYSLSGVFIEQAEKFNPEVLDSFKRLVDTGRAELLEETYHHSLSFLYSKDEFKRQVKLHRDKIKEHFGVEPKVFRNTELIYNNDLAKEIEEMGYQGIIAEGADHILGWRSPNFVYKPKGAKNLKLLLKNYKLSDDIAFRFSNKGWSDHPLTAEKFSNWVNDHHGNGHLINLFMDYETFGEHQWESTGIFDFLSHLPEYVLRHPDNSFVTPSEAIAQYQHFDELDYPHFVSWADTERDLSAWLSNSIQKDAAQKLYSLEKDIMAYGDDRLIEDWRKMQTSDHFYYMCTKYFSDGDVHKYFNPYETPYEAFITYMNILSDIRHRLDDCKKVNKAPTSKKVVKKTSPKKTGAKKSVSKKS
ncbi:MAG: Glycosyl hydrolase family 57 [bacterium ADurb.Bin212]|nr:MAG: Glycosyl hydrolase family 57 [bacterium ADurb.Bin212]